MTVEGTGVFWMGFLSGIFMFASAYCYFKININAVANGIIVPVWIFLIIAFLAAWGILTIFSFLIFRKSIQDLKVKY